MSEKAPMENGGKEIDEANSAALPANRYRQLGWVLRRHFFGIVVCSAYVFLFSLPLIAWAIFCTAASFLEQANLFNTLLIYGGVALLLPLTGLGLAGSSHYFKKLTWNQGADVNSNFLDGIRENGGNGALDAFLAGLAYLSVHLLVSLINASGETLNPYLAAVFIGISYAFLFISLTVLCVHGSIMMTYEGGFLPNLLVALKIGLVNLYKGIFLYALAFLPFILFEFVNSFFFNIALIAISAVFYFGFSSLLSVLYCNSLFDIAFNRRLYPEAYRRGLLGQGDVEFDPKSH